ncbi:MAG: 50S ribosomal protein L17 [Parcubacteria group bacterium ADurb.Bin159]|jgi:large subunit ribosomal protein L17|nr:MAG: 50S ribosomal protein L17 [Parcubacteria group bacterium ADurb.Bin159]
MRHRKEKKILSRKTGPRKALKRGLAVNLILYERIQTTEAKAKVLRPFIEKIISLGKGGDLAARRKVMSLIGNRAATKKLIEEIAPRYKERKGGYTRIIKTGVRKGDNAKMALIEFV